eukprot:5911675-Pleurochrysis_carterae.AAC.1
MHAAREYEYRLKVHTWCPALPPCLCRLAVFCPLLFWNLGTLEPRNLAPTIVYEFCSACIGSAGSAIARQCWPGQRRAADVDGIPARVECSPV